MGKVKVTSIFLRLEQEYIYIHIYRCICVCMHLSKHSDVTSKFLFSKVVEVVKKWIR